MVLELGILYEFTNNREKPCASSAPHPRTEMLLSVRGCLCRPVFPGRPLPGQLPTYCWIAFLIRMVEAASGRPQEVVSGMTPTLIRSIDAYLFTFIIVEEEHIVCVTGSILSYEEWSISNDIATQLLSRFIKHYFKTKVINKLELSSKALVHKTGPEMLIYTRQTYILCT